MENWTATLVQGFYPPDDLLFKSQGSTQVQPNGNVLVNWGSEGAITEYKPNGEPIFHFYMDSGSLDHEDRARKPHEACSRLSSSSTTTNWQFKSRPDLTPPKLNITIPATADVESGYIFIAPFAGFPEGTRHGPLQAAPYIFTDTCDLVWSGFTYFSIWATNFQAGRYKGKDVLFSFEGSHNAAYGHGHLRAGNHRLTDKHEFIITNEKTALIHIYHPVPYDLSPYGGSPEQQWIVDARFQELDINSGEVLFEWSSLSHVSPSEAFLPLNPGQAGSGYNSSDAWDYFHINSVDKDDQGNYLISARDANAAYKIDGRTSEILWQLSVLMLYSLDQLLNLLARGKDLYLVLWLLLKIGTRICSEAGPQEQIDRRHDTYETSNGEQEPLLSNVAIASPAKSTWKPPAGFIWIEIAIFSNVFLSGFDGTITASTYAVIGPEFNAANTISWLTTSYLVTSTAFQPLYGRFSDIIGRRVCFFTATLTFLVGCLGCALAPDLVSLNLMRALTGLGGGGLMTMATIISSDMIPFRERGMYQACQNVLHGFGSICGASLGGVIADTIGRRWCFMCQVPVSAFACIVGYFVVKDLLSNTFVENTKRG
ncbi:hypothetical protein VE02_07158 [Pseudogymnoascus sp. 03VT05]|nr:hypothetical protein VE02_07158 [Pseudogymnoascus sp. 03VT05]